MSLRAVDDRSSKRRSVQISESAFETILSSNATQQISLSRDVDDAASPKERPSSRSSSISSEYNSKRRSMYRSPGTASSPDLATLIKKAKETKAAPADEPPEVEVDDASTVHTAQTAQEDAESPSLGDRRRSARDSSIASTSSYIVVPDFKELSLSSANEYRDRTLSLGARPANPSSMAARLEAANDPTSFTDKMRRTSGFFKRKFGSSNRTGTSSVPTTPTGGFPNIDAPPVPSLPAQFAKSPRRSTNPNQPPPPVPPKKTTDAYADETLRRRSMSVNDSLVASTSKGSFRGLPTGESQLAISSMDWDTVLAGLAENDMQRAEMPSRRRARSPSAKGSKGSIPDYGGMDRSESAELLHRQSASSPSISVLPASARRRSPDSNASTTPIGSPALPSVIRHSPSPLQARTTMSPSSSAANLSTPTRANPRHSVVGLVPNLDPASFVKPVYNRSKRSLEDVASGSKEELDEGTFDETAREAADKCWRGDESFLKRHKVAEYLGSSGRLNQQVLAHYIDKFDFQRLRLDAAFRTLCDKLYLKAETQQVDRILDRFSRKYWQDNPDAVFGSSDIVHATVYSLLLLNTDLHIAELTSRMSSKQFVRNTMAAIHAQFPAGAKLPSRTSGRSLTLDSYPASEAAASGSSRGSFEKLRDNLSRTKRSDSVSSFGSDGHDPGSHPVMARQKSMPVPSTSQKTWDADMELLLKDIYQEIKARPIYQPLSSNETEGRSSISLSPTSSPYATWRGDVSRTASRRSQVSVNGSDRNISAKRASIRGFGFLGSDPMRSASPSPSTNTSLSDSLAATGYGSSLTAASSPFASTPIIGFAGSLSQTIIREQQEDDAQSDDGMLATEEELALLGAPWAKEGILQRKHYWEAPSKRSKDKTWLQVFVVIAKGEVRMFKFGDSSAKGSSSGMGGGNWMINAQAVGELSLTHSLCSALPPPGYSNSRPHVFVLTLANGSSYFFQAGTEDLVQEWVSTCNYWAARLSKEPLLGGVSNIDYGWKRITKLASDALEGDDKDTEDLASIRSGKSGKSHKSGRSSRSRVGHRATSSFGVSVGNMNDRAHISEWKAPLPPTSASKLSEEGQMASLRQHVHKMQGELADHNELRGPMTRLFSSRSPNATKASSNWERKSQYLLSEIVKYTRYIDSLQIAIKLRQVRSAQKIQEQLLKDADEGADDSPGVSAISLPRNFSTAPQNTPLDESFPSSPARVPAFVTSRPMSNDSFDTAPQSQATVG